MYMDCWEAQSGLSDWQKEAHIWAGIWTAVVLQMD